MVQAARSACHTHKSCGSTELSSICSLLTSFQKADLILGLTPVTALADLSDPTNTSISVITPPGVTLALLEDAEQLGIRNMWLQPGTFDDAVLQRVKQLENKINVIAQGRCILVEGSEDLAIAEAHGGRKL